MPRTLKIGHRGAPRTCPENTLSSFRKAMELGADGIELDLHVCKSGELVVIHDETVNRTTDGKGRVAELTYAELRSLTVEGKERIPALAEVFDALGRDAHYFIEVKAAEAALPAAALMHQYVKRGWQAENLRLISFNHVALQQALRQFPTLHTGASYTEMKQEYIAATKLVCARAVIPQYKTLTAQHVQAAHREGLMVVPWTVNEAADITRLAAMGVDAIISDYPDRLATLLP